MLQQTIEEQDQHFRWHRRRKQAMTPRRLLRESDDLLYWVEECMVQEMRIVPGWLVARLMVVLRHAHPECPRCGYLGWAPVEALSESEREALRLRPPERRRLRLA